MANHFLKVDGIAGESTDAKHKGEIELVSWSWGAVQSGTMAHGGGGGEGKATFHDFTFVQHEQTSSPPLFLACVTGQHLKTVTLTARTVGKTPLEYLTIQFSDVLVSSFQESGHDGERALESVSFQYARIEISYRPQGAAGKPGAEVKAAYDVRGNKTL